VIDTVVTVLDILVEVVLLMRGVGWDGDHLKDF
jgi:hypothetical protein